MKTASSKCWYCYKTASSGLSFYRSQLRGSGFSWDLRLIEATMPIIFLIFLYLLVNLVIVWSLYDSRRRNAWKLKYYVSSTNLLQYLKSKDIHIHFVDDNKLTPPSRAFMKYSMNPWYITLNYIVRVFLFLWRNLFCCWST